MPQRGGFYTSSCSIFHNFLHNLIAPNLSISVPIIVCNNREEELHILLPLAAFQFIDQIENFPM